MHGAVGVVVVMIVNTAEVAMVVNMAVAIVVLVVQEALH